MFWLELVVYVVVISLLLFLRYTRKISVPVKAPERRIIKPIVVPRKKKLPKITREEPQWRIILPIEKKAEQFELEPIPDGLRAPPPSPVNVYVTPIPFEEEEAFELPDLDNVRRRSYVRKQITDGEVMMDIMGTKICLIFVHGIEYHYVHELGCDPCWNLPKTLTEKCQSWYLSFPKQKQRKLNLPTPPAPIEHTAGTEASYSPTILYY